jgi:hypothetical protein
VATENVEFVLTARDATSATLDRVKASLGELGSNMASVAAQGAALIASAGFIALKFGEMADKLDTARVKLGIHAQTLRDWQHVAGLSNIEGDQLVAMLQRLEKSAGEAASGANKQLIATFEALGISQEDLRGKLSNLEALYPAVLAGLKNLENQYGQTKLASDLMGRGGAALIPVLQQSQAEVDALTDKFHRQAGVLTDEQVKALADAKDEWDGFINTLKERGLTVFAEVSGWLTSMSDGAITLARSLRTASIQEEIATIRKEIDEATRPRTRDESLWEAFLDAILPDISAPAPTAELRRRLAELEAEKNIIAEAVKRDSTPAAAAEEKPQKPFIDPVVAAKDEQTRRLNEFEDIRTKYAQDQANARVQGEMAANSLAIEGINNFELQISESVQRGVDLQKAADKQRIVSASQSALQHLAIATSGSKALFQVSKAAALADAIINTYKAVQVARASAPPPYNYVLAAIELAAGLANVAAIASASFGSAAGVAGQNSGPGGLAPAIPEARPPDVRTSPGDQQPNNVVLTVKGGDSAGRALLELLSVEVNANDGVFIKPGSRQAAELAT